MATYPATNNSEAIDLNISNANQFFTILQGGIEDTIPTYEGNGEIPSVSKALAEAAAYREPIAWATIGEETNLLQPRNYDGNIYVPLKVPAPLSASPDEEYWRLYSPKDLASFFATNVETFTATSGQTEFTLSTSSYLPGNNNVAVYVNGSRLYPSEYTETSSTEVTLNLRGSGMRLRGSETQPWQLKRLPRTLPTLHKRLLLQL